MNDCGGSIEQAGIVLESCGDHVRVSVLGSACSACHKSLCMLGESKAKEINVKTNDHVYQAGERVVVSIDPSSGYMAVVTLYLIPFLVMFITLWLTTMLGIKERTAGLSSLLILIPYFGAVFLLRGKLQHHCKIAIRKNESDNSIHGH